ncbi:ABC transporter substrate-binding protein [Pelobacter seleniigenes]|uniref:ABC transporter substrate-binding protein n=1 Tax=Pelobacter seleniigenes TaxID=407188 RepID=UPI0004A76E68|nr:ABC transporter substrate-binding protein [Pelobacter seleniigenes]
MRFARSIVYALIVATSALSLSIAPDALAAKSDDTLVVGTTRGVATVDRLYSVKREGLILSRLTDDGLFMVDPETLDYVPLAAKSYQYQDDVTLDITLRDGIKFHDGSPFGADDVVYTYNWMLDENQKTSRGTVIQRWLKSVQKLDEKTVRFNLKFDYPLVFRDMAITVMLRKKGTYDTEEGIKASSFGVNGIGPYRVVEFEPGKDVILERFADYYADSPKGRPAIKYIKFRVIPDIGTQQAELMSGGIQFLYGVPIDIAENIGRTGRANYLTGGDVTVAFMILDAAGYTAKNNPFTKLEVRRAFNYAINREAIVKNITRGASVVLNTPCHPLQFGCSQDVTKYEYNPAKAKELLAEAGYPNGFEFDLWAYREKPVAEAIMGDLAKIGVTAKMRYVKSTALGKARKSRETQVIFAAWGAGGTADAAMTLNNHFSLDSDRDFTGDAEVSQLVADAEKVRDKKVRAELYQKALTRITDQAYWVPIFGFSQNYLTSKDLNFAPPKDGLPRLYQASWR